MLFSSIRLRMSLRVLQREPWVQGRFLDGTELLIYLSAGNLYREEVQLLHRGSLSQIVRLLRWRLAGCRRPTMHKLRPTACELPLSPD